MPTMAKAPRHLLAVDAVLAGALLLLGELAQLTGESSLPHWAGIALTAGYTAPLAARRLLPIPVSLATIAGVVALGLLDPLGYQPTIPLAVALAAFTFGAHVRQPYSWILASGSLVAFWSSMLASDVAAPDLVFAFLMYAPPYGFGASLRARGQRAAEQAERAAADERARIARELHDIVAHSLSVVTLQTQAVRRRLEPTHAGEAQTLHDVERTARDAMAEMRRLLGTVRSGPAPLVPQPGLALLDTLLEETRRTGVAIESTVEGVVTPLNPGLDLTGYRVVQEALTNVRRHSRATHAGVSLRYGHGFLEIDVRDNGTQPARHARPGHGLIGMRERVHLYGGEFTAGPEGAGGFRVRAVLPVEASA
jgi:signal transduction histidine kinase